jgi:adenosine deaminase CECR1
MFTANSKDKKRKRSSRSLASRASRMAEVKEAPPDGGLSTEDHKVIFDRFLATGNHSKAYSQERAALLRAEAVDAWDHDASTSATEIENRAAIIVREIREYERRVVFGNNASEAIPGPETRDMGGQFLTNKEWIEQKSELFRIAKEVPKGAILHLHFNAELNPERLLEQAREMDNMYVWSIRPILTEDDLDQTEMMFKVMSAETKSNDIFSPEYEGKPGTWKPKEYDDRVWMRWKEFQVRFKEKFPGQYIQKPEEKAVNTALTCSEQPAVELDQAEYWIKQKMVLSEEEAYQPSQTVNGYVYSGL